MFLRELPRPELDVLPSADGEAVTGEFLVLVLRYRPQLEILKTKEILKTVLMMVIFLPDIISLMVNVEALVFKTSLKKNARNLKAVSKYLC